MVMAPAVTPDGDRRAAPGCAVDIRGAAEFGNPVPDVREPGSGVPGSRVEAGPFVADDEFRVPVLAGQRHGQLAYLAVPDGVRARLLGDAQQGMPDRRGNGNVVQAGVDDHAEPVVVVRAQFLQGSREPGTVQAGRAQLGQQRLHAAQCLLADPLDHLSLLVARVGAAHPGGDHPQREQVLGDRVVHLPGDPGPLRGAGIVGGALPLRGHRGAELPGHRGEVRFKAAELVPAGGGQGHGVVAVGHRERRLLQAAHPADEAPRGGQAEQEADRHDGGEQRQGPLPADSARLGRAGGASSRR